MHSVVYIIIYACIFCKEDVFGNSPVETIKKATKVRVRKTRSGLDLAMDKGKGKRVSTTVVNVSLIRHIFFSRLESCM